MPEGWVEAEAGDLGTWSSGGTPLKKHIEYYGGNIPWVRTGDLKHRVLDNVEGRISDLGMKNSAAKLFPQGTLLIAMYGATIGKTAVTSFEATTNQACAALLAEGETQSLIPYVWRYFISLEDYLNDIGQGGAQPNISQQILKKQRIPLPPLAEQKRIVAKLDVLGENQTAARAALDRIPSLVEQYKKAAIRTILFTPIRSTDCSSKNPSFKALEEKRNAFKNSLRGSRLDSDTGLTFDCLPVGALHWARVYLGQVIEFTSGFAFKSAWYSPKGRRLLRGVNVAPGTLDWSNVKYLPEERAKKYSNLELSTGDIILAMDRPLISTGLKVARVDHASDGALLVQRVARIRPTKYILSEYLWHIINSDVFLNHALARATGTDLPHISSNDIQTTPILLPSLEMQRAIVERIDAAFAEIDKLAKAAAAAREKLDSLDRAILAKAFRGQLVPQDPNDEPASVLLERIKAERDKATKEIKTTKTKRKRKSRN